MTDRTSKPSYEEKEIRCPKLGGQVSFAYCRVEDSGRPCARCLTCWHLYFDVEAHFRETLTPKEFDQCFCKPPPTKVGTLLEMIERARKIAEEKAREDKED
ncbi:hypothetical protein ACFL2Q_14570 [Thermodesulfobacteriota bacterium]